MQKLSGVKSVIFVGISSLLIIYLGVIHVKNQSAIQQFKLQEMRHEILSRELNEINAKLQNLSNHPRNFKEQMHALNNIEKEVAAISATVSEGYKRKLSGRALHESTQFSRNSSD